VVCGLRREGEGGLFIFVILPVVLSLLYMHAPLFRTLKHSNTFFLAAVVTAAVAVFKMDETVEEIMRLGEAAGSSQPVAVVSSGGRKEEDEGEEEEEGFSIDLSKLMTRAQIDDYERHVIDHISVDEDVDGGAYSGVSGKENEWGWVANRERRVKWKTERGVAKSEWWGLAKRRVGKSF
jgi:hypothetical protein